MQYPPQQPAGQPYHSPAEMFGQEQIQAYIPAQEITQPVTEVQEIAIYPNRTQAIVRTIICAICLLIVVLVIPVIAIIGASIGEPLKGSDLVSLVIVIPGIIFIGWITWIMVQMLLARKPALLITREGITVSKMPMLSGFFIPWAEIEALAPSRYMIYKYLCIVPRNPDQFLLRFNPVERFSRRLNSMIGSPLAVPQMYLGKPVEEILNTLYYGYANELNYYHIQLRP